MIRRIRARTAGIVAAVLVTGVMAAPAGAATGWVIQHVPKPGKAGASLDAVSCVAGGQCEAVGYSLAKNARGQQVRLPLAERKTSGDGWTIQSVPEPADAGSDYLAGVSCTSASFCVAAGTNQTGGVGPLPLAEMWDGTSWTVMAVPLAAGSTGELGAVSCTSATACMAVGSQQNSSSVNGTLAVSWDGSSWTIASPGGGGTLGDLAGVSCTAAAACTAVGISNEAPLAERWNGTAWTVQPVPLPAGASGGGLEGVSCASTAACTAVGLVSPAHSADDNQLIERWNGTAWAVQAGAGGESVLSGVSCDSVTRCTAVGEPFSPPGPPVAESWTPAGGWILQDAPAPPRAMLARLSGVSCPAAANCTAAGGYSIDRVAEVGNLLAEHE